MFFNEFLYAINLSSTKASTVLQSYRVKPEFSLVIISLNVNMRWLITIICIKEESIRPASQYSWHCSNPSSSYQ